MANVTNYTMFEMDMESKGDLTRAIGTLNMLEHNYLQSTSPNPEVKEMLGKALDVLNL